MEQNNMWKRYLTLGLIISIIALFYSCDKGDYRYTKKSEFRFINTTNYSITYPVGYERFNILPKSSIFFEESIFVGDSKKSAEISDYKSPLESSSVIQNLTIKFDNMKCLVDVSLTDVNSIRDIKNFVAEKLGESNYKFTYTFTEADYNRAVACP